MPARSVCLVALSLSEAGPGRFGGQVSVTDIYHTTPCHAMPYPDASAARHPSQTSTIPCHAMPYHTIPYHTIPYHTIPCRVVHFSSVRWRVHFGVFFVAHIFLYGTHVVISFD